MTEHHGITNEKSPKAIARHELLCTLEDVICQAAKLLRPGGSFYMVHRPFRLVDIMVLMREYHLEPKRMKLVYQYIDKDPNMVLIEGLRGGRPRMTVEKPLIVYKEPGVIRMKYMKFTDIEGMKRGKHVWNIIFMCYTDWKSRGYYPESAGYACRGGSDCCRGYQKYD